MHSKTVLKSFGFGVIHGLALLEVIITAAKKGVRVLPFDIKNVS